MEGEGGTVRVDLRAVNCRESLGCQQRRAGELLTGTKAGIVSVSEKLRIYVNICITVLDFGHDRARNLV